MSVEAKAELYRKLPSVDELTKSLTDLVQREGAPAVAAAARDVLGRLRDEITAGRMSASGVDLALAGLSDAVGRQLARSLQYSLRPVVNATGVVLHTNLGRAPIAPAAIGRISRIAGGYTNLEFDVASGERGQRDVHADRLFAKFLSVDGDVSTVVVNNCAAAVLLALNSLAEGGEVIVSRGELVEIGGGFRVPEVMARRGRRCARWGRPIAPASPTTSAQSRRRRGCCCVCIARTLRSWDSPNSPRLMSWWHWERSTRSQSWKIWEMVH